MHDFWTTLKLKQTILTDGAMGSYLISKGFPVSSCLARLNITNPQIIEGIHREYIHAGATMIYTHTFAANYHQLRLYGCENLLTAINEAAVKNAKRAKQGTSTFIAGNIGPQGGSLHDVSWSDYTKLCVKQLEVLVESGVDLMAIESMISLKETQTILKACAKICPKGMPILLSFCPDEQGRLPDNTDLTDWVKITHEFDIAVLGINCMQGPQSMFCVLNKLITLVNLPLIIKPSAGLPLQKGDQWSYPVDSKIFARDIKKMLHEQIALIGGCCGTTPGYIGELAKGGRRKA